MTMPELPTSKSARRLRWLSAGGRNARSNIQSPAQIDREPSPLNAASLLLMRRIAIGQCVGSSRLRSGTSSAAIKSP